MQNEPSAPLPLRQSLVEQALAMVERGETDVSLRAVARAAGVSAMAPYRHFEDRAALLRAVAREGFAMLRARAAMADSVPDPAEALARQGLCYIRFAREKPALFRLMFVDEAGLGLQPEECSGAHDLLAARVATLAPPHRQQAATLACWAIVHGLATLALDGRLSLGESEERAALALLMDAVRAS